MSGSCWGRRPGSAAKPDAKDLEIVVLRHHSRCCAGTDAAMCVGVEVHSFDIAQILYNGFVGEIYH